MPDPGPTKCYSLFVGIAGAALTITFSVFLGKRSAKSTASHPANAEPSYKTAATLAGYYDSEGMFLGGAPRWNDWTDDSYSCLTASENGTYCVEWSSERFANGLSTAMPSMVCACTAYETRTSCTTTPTPTPTPTGPSPTPTSTPGNTPTPTPNNDDDDNYDDDDDDDDGDDVRRRMDEGAEEEVDTTGTTCTSREVCVTTNCSFIQTKLYTSCDCDPDGENASLDGVTWWLEHPYCQYWRCSQGTALVTLDDGESSLLYSSVNGTRTYVRAVRELDYSCSTEGGLPGGAFWCNDWRGMTSVPGNVVEQLCECNINNSTVDGAEGYCLDWSCTTYFMTRCPVCSVVTGALLGALVLFVMAPLVVAWFMGNRQGQFAAPTGVAASILLAVYLGGIALVWTVLLPTAVAIVIIGRLFAKHKLHGKVNPST